MLRRALLAAIGITLACAQPLHGQRHPPAARARAATDRLVHAYMRDQRVPGASIAIVVNDSLVYAGGFGWANLEDSVPVTRHTLFPSASTAKLLTATAVAQLVERGVLALNQPIETHCPAYPPKPWPVTVGYLLVHQGGIRPSGAADVFNRVHYGSIQAAVAAFARDTLVAPPGTREIYSNAGYVLLACAVEGASGEPFDAYLRTHVLIPAGMTATQQASLYGVVAHRSGAYMVRTAANTRAWVTGCSAVACERPCSPTTPPRTASPRVEGSAGSFRNRRREWSPGWRAAYGPVRRRCSFCRTSASRRWSRPIWGSSSLGPCSIRLPLRGGTGSSEGRKDEGRQHPLPAFRFHPADH
jgi:CubicO group peptidase (beta-lactamase class C family)